MLPGASGETALPQSPSDVVLALREHFEGSATPSDVDPFAALRSSSSASAALYPDGLPAEMPAFVLPGHTLLPGEHASFVFFEPRYRRLCELALHGQPPDGRFVHLATPRAKADLAPVGTLVSILRHERLDDGRYAVECLAGPRVEVVAQREELLPRGDPLLHATLAPYCDALPRAEAEEGLARCAELLSLLRRGATGRGGWGGLSHFPPVLNAERFGLWLCALLLPPTALQQRLEWLHSRDAAARLVFAQQLMEGSLALAQPRPAAEGEFAAY